MVSQPKPIGHASLSPEDAQGILALRLLIARAANSDSLAWWDDSALTPAADFVLERLFPIAPALAGRALALKAALARHDAVCPSGTLHLYRLDSDGQDRLALRTIALDAVTVPDGPITSLDELREQLLALTKRPMAYTVVDRRPNGSVVVNPGQAPSGIHPARHRARALAWAYLEGTSQIPVFPYCMEDTV
jgi:hypothetical protein